MLIFILQAHTNKMESGNLRAVLLGDFKPSVLHNTLYTYVLQERITSYCQHVEKQLTCKASTVFEDSPAAYNISLV